MRPQGTTSWLLDRRIGWGPIGSTGDRAVGQTGSDLRLATNPSGRLSLSSLDGSLGGLVLPRGMAFDEDRNLYLLDREHALVKKFDAEGSRTGEWFKPLALERIVPGDDPLKQAHAPQPKGSFPGQLACPMNIAFAGPLMYVVDWGNSRVQVFCRNTYKLLYIWGPDVGHAVETVQRTAEIRWCPIDVATWRGDAFIVDDHNSTVYRHCQGSDAPCPLFAAQDPGTRWVRIALDKEGRIYLLNRQLRQLDVYDAGGQPVSQPAGHGDQRPRSPAIITDPGDVRGRFEPPPILMDHDGRFCVPPSLIRECPREFPDPPPSLESPLDPRGCQPEAAPPEQTGVLFARNGEPAGKLDPLDSLGPPIYAPGGSWFSGPLDSQIAACRWDRVELKIGHLPPGTVLSIYTYTDEFPRSASFVKSLQPDEWNLGFRFQAARQRRLDDERPTPFDRHDFLVQSRDGQYLWLKIEMTSDGYSTPRIESIRIHYPRESYLEDLPAVFSEDDQSRRFLENFLAVVQTEWNSIERRTDDVAELFDPRAAGRTFVRSEVLQFLSQWLGIEPERNWTENEQRRFLTSVPQAFSTDRGASRRSTLQSIRDYLRAYLRNITGLEPYEQGAFPVLVEGYRERHFLETAQAGSRLAGKTPLWSRSVVNRLQTDVHARLGETRLVSTGDPARDYFHHFAHRFRVFLPATWVRSHEDEKMICRALDDEKPAHTQYELHLVEPSFRVGVQATLGIDTLMGNRRPALLPSDQMPSSKEPTPRLGMDSFLGGDHAEPQLTASQRLGINTILREKEED